MPHEVVIIAAPFQRPRESVGGRGRWLKSEGGKGIDKPIRFLFPQLHTILSKVHRREQENTNTYPSHATTERCIHYLKDIVLEVYLGLGRVAEVQCLPKGEGGAFARLA